MAAVTRIKGEGNFFANLIDAILYTAGINLDPHILTYPNTLGLASIRLWRIMNATFE